jgi:hypothetical protein
VRHFFPSRLFVLVLLVSFPFPISVYSLYNFSFLSFFLTFQLLLAVESCPFVANASSVWTGHTPCHTGPAQTKLKLISFRCEEEVERYPLAGKFIKLSFALAPKPLPLL